MKHPTTCPACGVAIPDMTGIQQRAPSDKSHRRSYRVRLRINGERRHIGDYPTLPQAIAARDKAVNRAKASLADALATLNIEQKD
jgi:hypothetical protein